jgi:hypothetical protein
MDDAGGGVDRNSSQVQEDARFEIERASCFAVALAAKPWPKTLA